MPRSNLPAGHRRREGTHPLLEEGDGRVVDAVADRQLDAEMGLGGGYNQVEARELEGHLPVGAEEDELGELVCIGRVLGRLHLVDGDPRFRVCSRGPGPQRGEVLRVRKLVRGGPKNDTYICDVCVDVCNDIIFGEAPSITRPLRMAWRALRWWMTGRVPPGEQGPPTPN